MKKTQKKELILIIIILAAAGLWWGTRLFFDNSQIHTIRIEVDGELYGTYSLSEDQTVFVGDTNVCDIRDGKAQMTEASCPDHLCMRQGPVDSSGGMIVCLPNKVVIEGEK